MLTSTLKHLSCKNKRYINSIFGIHPPITTNYPLSFSLILSFLLVHLASLPFFTALSHLLSYSVISIYLSGLLFSIPPHPTTSISSSFTSHAHFPQSHLYKEKVFVSVCICTTKWLNLWGYSLVYMGILAQETKEDRWHQSPMFEMI